MKNSKKDGLLIQMSGGKSYGNNKDETGRCSPGISRQALGRTWLCPSGQPSQTKQLQVVACRHAMVFRPLVLSRVALAGCPEVFRGNWVKSNNISGLQGKGKLWQVFPLHMKLRQFAIFHNRRLSNRICHVVIWPTKTCASNDVIWEKT